MDSAAASFILGDDAANKQYRAILHFDTSDLPDTAVITKVTLKIMKEAQVGTSPFSTHGSLRVDIRKLFFGSAAGLELVDFQAASSALDVAAFSPTPTGNWYSATLNTSAGRAQVNRTGATQFRLRFLWDDNNDSGADYLTFSSGSAAAANRPQLIIQYYLP
jgi:hypothetical protein